MPILIVNLIYKYHHIQAAHSPGQDIGACDPGRVLSETRSVVGAPRGPLSGVRSTCLLWSHLSCRANRYIHCGLQPSGLDNREIVDGTRPVYHSRLEGTEIQSIGFRHNFLICMEVMRLNERVWCSWTGRQLSSVSRLEGE